MIGVRFVQLLAMVVVGLSAYAMPDPETVRAVLEAQPACQNFVRFDEQNLYLGFGPYRLQYEEPRNPIPSTVTVTPFDKPDQGFVLATADAAIDAIRDGSRLFVLTYSGLEEWDLNTRTSVAIHPTYNWSGAKAYKQHAEAFARYQDKFIIAHGRLGLSFFDLKQGMVTNQYQILDWQRPLESMAVGVTVQGKYAYVAIDDYTPRWNGEPPAYKGVLVVDMDSEKVVAELAGLDPGSDSIASDGKKLIVSYGGNPIWTYNLADIRLNSKNLPAPRFLYKFPFPGNPTGHAALDDKYYYTCYSKAPAAPGGSYVKIPLALDRAQLSL